VSKNKVEFAGLISLPRLIEYLEELKAGFEAGRAALQLGPQYVQLRPGAILKVEVEAKEKEGKAKFQLEVSWKKGGKGETLTISQLTAVVIG
jgi:amphi-Trp domain-containing protein